MNAPPRPDSRPSKPTVPPPQPENLNSALNALQQRRRQETASATRQQRLAEAITSFTGSMQFVYLHLHSTQSRGQCRRLAGGAEVPSLFRDPGDGGSVEAIFLSTFVLISQNRNAAAADKRAGLGVPLAAHPEIEEVNASTPKPPPHIRG